MLQTVASASDELFGEMIVGIAIRAARVLLMPMLVFVAVPASADRNTFRPSLGVLHEPDKELAAAARSRATSTTATSNSRSCGASSSSTGSRWTPTWTTRPASSTSSRCCGTGRQTASRIPTTSTRSWRTTRVRRRSTSRSSDDAGPPRRPGSTCWGSSRIPADVESDRIAVRYGPAAAACDEGDRLPHQGTADGP